MALSATFGSDVLDIINKCKVLVVGAGGIGCELLKNLVSTGFKDIETIDLDTIEVSNLNRQFLFRKCHVGKSKAKTACDVVKQFDSSITIQGHLGNIKSSEFDSEYFDKFDIVLNALDNTEARRHVNRLCLSTKKSFIESGTEGFIGQVIPIIPKVTQCWECTPKETNTRTYPVCTIRSTPDKPVHCIVWAKLIFALLFGVEDDTNIIKDLKVEMKENENIEEFVKNTFIYLFERDIEEQLSMTDKWKNRESPITIRYNELESKIESLSIDTSTNTVRKVLSIEENVQMFMKTMNELLVRKKSAGELVFDKDDHLTMSFVSCAANLRMYCYHIDRQSEFDNKGIAGNIIHAIATTNAVVAGAMVVQAIHILKRNKQLQAEEQKVKEDGLNTLPTRVCWVQSNGRKWLYPMTMEGPNKQCFICQKSIVHLTLSPLVFNFGRFVKQILQKHLGFKQPDMTIESISPYTDEAVSNYIESVTEDDDEEEKKEKEMLRGKRLDDVGIKIYDKASLSIEDFSQDVSVNLVVHYLELDPEKHPNGFEITNEWKADKFTVAEAKQNDSHPPAEPSVSVSNKENKASEENGETGKNKYAGKKRKEMDCEGGHCDEDKSLMQEPPAKKLKTC
eukprot:26322_1